MLDAQPPSVPVQIFGNEPVHGWCYHYQKASLARQAGDWDTLANLTQSVLDQNLNPQYLVEWMPFLEGLVHDGQIESARAIVENSNADDRQRELICEPYQSNDRLGAAATSTEMVDFIRTSICPTQVP